MFTFVNKFRDLDTFNYGDFVSINTIDDFISGTIIGFSPTIDGGVALRIERFCTKQCLDVSIKDMIWICSSYEELDLGI